MAMVSRLKIERLRKGFTLENLEKSTGVKYYRLWMIENGLLPKPEQMTAIAESLEVNVWDIFPCFVEDQWNEYFITR